MAWRIAKSLDVLRSEINTRWPDRNKASDGVIGDAAHAASASDHNPNQQGVVCAFDITHDPAGCDGSTVFALLVSRRHPCLKYVIWNRTVVRAYDKPGLPAWTPSPYTGADPHTNHVHVSVGVGRDGQSQPPYDDLDSWGVLTPAQPEGDGDLTKDENAALGSILVLCKEQAQRTEEIKARLDKIEEKLGIKD